MGAGNGSAVRLRAGHRFRCAIRTALAWRAPRPLTSRTLRRALAWTAAGAVLAGGIVVVNGPLAAAAPGPNPSVELSLARVFDGTGHGTSQASFVNTANGFVPGDDTATDGIVSSGDLVGYEISLRFAPAPARTVAVGVSASEYLDAGAEALAQFCQSAPGASARVQGASCLFTITAGASVAVTRMLPVTAKDSRGIAVAKQEISVSVGLQGQNPHASAAGDAVTVVSAPLADVTIRPAASSYLWNGDGRGGFTVGPTALRRAGFSPTKGATTARNWSARVNVSAFPAGTTWSAAGLPLTVTDGWVQGVASGTVLLEFALPDGKWPELIEGDSQRFEVQLDVPKTAFATPDYLNNGDGSQPGGGKPKTFATFDPATGATAGTVFPNNDFSAVTVVRPVAAQEAVFGKRIQYPRDDSMSKFEPGNRFWANAAQTGVSNPDRPAELAPGAQFRQRLSVDTRAVKRAGRPAQAPQVLVSDEWDPALQRVDGLVNVAGPDGTPVDPAAYTLAWSTTATGDAVADPTARDGWLAQEEAPEGARALRVVFAPDALPVDADAGAGLFTVTLPSRLREGITPADGVLAQDTLRGRLNMNEVTSAPGVVRLVFPATPTLQLAHTTNPASVHPGGESVFTVTPTVLDPVVVSEGFTPEVSVELDRCATAPVNRTPGWQMTAVEAVAGPSGRVCGDPASTPARLVFSPAASPMYAETWNAGAKSAALPRITYAAQVTQTARNAVANTAVFALTGAQPAGSGTPVPAAGDAVVGVLAQTSSLAQVTADPVKVQPGEPLGWTVDLVSRAHPRPCWRCRVPGMRPATAPWCPRGRAAGRSSPGVSR